MSDNLEQQLRAARRVEPSRELDRRMDELFAAPPVRARTRRWWALLLPAAGVAAAFALIRFSPKTEIVPVPPAAPDRIVYQVEARGLMREMLVPSAHPPALPALEATVRL